MAPCVDVQPGIFTLDHPLRSVVYIVDAFALSTWTKQSQGSPHPYHHLCATQQVKCAAKKQHTAYREKSLQYIPTNQSVCARQKECLPVSLHDDQMYELQQYVSDRLKSISGEETVGALGRLSSRGLSFPPESCFAQCSSSQWQQFFDCLLERVCRPPLHSLSCFASCFLLRAAAFLMFAQPHSPLLLDDAQYFTSRATLRF